MQQKSSGRILLEILWLVLAVGAAGVILLTVYTYSALGWARRSGVYETPGKENTKSQRAEMVVFCYYVPDSVT